MQENLNRFGVRRHDDQFTDTAIQRFRRFVGTLLGLLVVGSLLDQIQQGNGQFRIRKGKGFFGHVSSVVVVRDWIERTGGNCVAPPHRDAVYRYWGRGGV